MAISCVMSAEEPFRVGYRAVWRRARGRPLLTLDEHGVTLHSARVTLPWADVAEVRIVAAPVDVLTVVFVPYDPEAGGPVHVRVHDLAVEFEDLLTAIHRFTDAPINQRYTATA